MCAHSSADRVPGYEPVGRGFEPPWARQKSCLLCRIFIFYSESDRLCPFLLLFAPYAAFHPPFCRFLPRKAHDPAGSFLFAGFLGADRLQRFGIAAACSSFSCIGFRRIPGSSGYGLVTPKTVLPRGKNCVTIKMKWYPLICAHFLQLYADLTIRGFYI